MDSPWAYKHRTHLRRVLMTIIFGSLTIYLGIKLYTPPSCFDHKQNQDELGVDCGGACDLYCSRQVQDMRLVWARAFEVSPGWWSALAYIQNPNFEMRTDPTPYRITLYDREGASMLTREGWVSINREPLLPVFVGRLSVESRTPYRTTFEWLAPSVWYKAPKVYEVTSEEQEFTRVGGGEELQVTIHNREPVPLHDIEVVAIVYDAEDNAMAVSETYIDFLSARAKKRVTFSWPQAFPTSVGRVEFLPRVPVQE